MRSQKSRLIAVAAIIPLALAVSALSIVSGCAKKGDAQQDTAALNAISPRAESVRPILKIDGNENSDIYLKSLDIQIEVTGNIASTRYTMAVKNRTDRVVEGALTFSLPVGSGVTYYALDIDGKMREAVPVKKARGTEVFDAIKRRMVDPGLLERLDDGTYRTRVYPFQAFGIRTISIGYEEELMFENAAMKTPPPTVNTFLRYNLPIDYPAAIDTFTVKATVWKSGVEPIVPDSANKLKFDRVGENCVASFTRSNYRPTGELNFALPASADTPIVIMQPARGGYYFFASVAPNLETRKKRWDGDLAIIWDVSLSGSKRDIKRELEILDIIFADKKDANVNLYFLNNKLRRIAGKKTSKGEFSVIDGKWDELKNTVETAVFDGGTDFSQINLDDIVGNEILFFSDGISTLSDADFLKNATAARPIHCVVSSAKIDYDAMKSIAAETKGKFVDAYILSGERLKRELLNEMPRFLRAEHGKGVRDVYPSAATPVYGNFSLSGASYANNAELTLLFGFGDTVEKRIKVTLDAKNADNRIDVRKRRAQRKIAALDVRHGKNSAELTEIGLRFGIVTRNTSLIVLETVGDYIRYGITPPTADPDLYAEYRREVKKRNIWDRTESTESTENADGIDGRPEGLTDGGSVAVSSAGSVGTGALNGGGNSKGRLLTQPTPAVSSNKGGGDPRARVGKSFFVLSAGPKGYILNRNFRIAKHVYADDVDIDFFDVDDMSDGDAEDFPKGGIVTGGRSEASIQRVVTQNIDKLRYAYFKRILKKPGLAGMITVKFFISSTGYVIDVKIQETTMHDPVFERAVLNEVSGWKFEWTYMFDNTEVTYPFIFQEIKNPQPTKKALQPREVPWNRDTLNRAEAAAVSLKNWWNTEFTPKKVAPDKRDSLFSDTGAGFEKGFTTGVPRKTSVYMYKLTGKTAEDYQIYLDTRNDYADSPAFYFDMANWFYARGDKETGIRILTSIADLEFENTTTPTYYQESLESKKVSIYRTLGYRLKEYGEYAPEKFVCRKVIRWEPTVAQNYRDYALALADNGEAQAALDSLYSILKRPSEADFTGLYPTDFLVDRKIAEVIVTDMNYLIAKNPNLNKSKIYKRLLVNIPVDVRVVVNWNIDIADIDLQVKDPNNEWCYANRRRTSMGGRISADIVGYGPEQFLLKKAVLGKYRVYVNYHSHHPDHAFSPNPSVVMAEIYTKSADNTERRQVISIQIPEARKIDGGNMSVAEFEI